MFLKIQQNHLWQHSAVIEGRFILLMQFNLMHCEVDIAEQYISRTRVYTIKIHVAAVFHEEIVTTFLRKSYKHTLFVFLWFFDLLGYGSAPKSNHLFHCPSLNLPKFLLKSTILTSIQANKLKVKQNLLVGCRQLTHWSWYDLRQYEMSKATSYIL